MYICILYAYTQFVNSKMPASTKPEIDWKAVGRRVREIRGFGVNQAQFALELGVSQGQLSRYEQGSSEIGAAVLLRLARKSGKTIEWVLTGRDRL
jgi:transcriptional regulator with XRE-family HTH domain